MTLHNVLNVLIPTVAMLFAFHMGKSDSAREIRRLKAGIRYRDIVIRNLMRIALKSELPIQRRSSDG